MTEYVHPDNPFAVTDNFKEVTPALISSAIETLAFVGAPPTDEASEVIVSLASEWALRVTGAGHEVPFQATAWELSAMISRYMQTGIPFPPFDITTTCGDPQCPEDHVADAQLVNSVFEAARTGDHAAAVKACTIHAHRHVSENWRPARVQCAAMVLVHASERVSQYRRGASEQLPSLD